MPKSEGKLFKFDNSKSIHTDFLETINYRGKEQNITIETEELTSVCPFSGLPDFMKVIIEYIPQKKIIELKSLKYYFISFRNVGIYQEDLTNRLFVDLEKTLTPKWIKVMTIYKTRGGINVTCVVENNKKG